MLSLAIVNQTPKAFPVNVLVLGSKIPRLPGDHFQYFRGSLA